MTLYLVFNLILHGAFAAVTLANAGVAIALRRCRGTMAMRVGVSLAFVAWTAYLLAQTWRAS